MDSLDGRDLGWTAEAGTVTRVVSRELRRARRPRGERRDGDPRLVDPDAGELTEHLRAWADMLCTIAGIPPLPDGVVPLPGQRR